MEGIIGAVFMFIFAFFVLILIFGLIYWAIMQFVGIPEPYHRPVKLTFGVLFILCLMFLIWKFLIPIIA